MSDSDEQPVAAVLELVDGLLERMDRESTGELRASTTALLEKLRGQPIPPDVRTRLEEICAEVAADLFQTHLAKTAAERELEEWIARKQLAHVAGRDSLVADSKERSDEWITKISSLETTCRELQIQLNELELLLKRP